ncbi:hypothetical protein C8J57DRAFT_1572094 [Mycena rebaudengoi]|nr:hypothetical protein C8J57DRAFT_1572094 [Mycena rebaudengoi]
MLSEKRSLNGKMPPIITPKLNETSSAYINHAQESSETRWYVKLCGGTVRFGAVSWSEIRDMDPVVYVARLLEIAVKFQLCPVRLGVGSHRATNWKRTLPTQTPLLTERRDNPSVVTLENSLLDFRERCHDRYWWWGILGYILATLGHPELPRSIVNRTVAIVQLYLGPYTSRCLRCCVALEAAETPRNLKIRPSLRFRAQDTVRPLLRSRTPDRRISASHRRCSSGPVYSAAQHGALKAPTASSPCGPAAPGSSLRAIRAPSATNPLHWRSSAQSSSRALNLDISSRQKHHNDRFSTREASVWTQRLPASRLYPPPNLHAQGHSFPTPPFILSAPRGPLLDVRGLSAFACWRLRRLQPYSSATCTNARHRCAHPPNARVVSQDCRPRSVARQTRIACTSATNGGASSGHQHAPRSLINAPIDSSGDCTPRARIGLHERHRWPADRASVAQQELIRERMCGAAGNVLCATADPGRIFVYGTDGWRWEAEGHRFCERQGEEREGAVRAVRTEVKKVKVRSNGAVRVREGGALGEGAQRGGNRDRGRQGVGRERSTKSSRPPGKFWSRQPRVRAIVRSKSCAHPSVFACTIRARHVSRLQTTAASSYCAATLVTCLRAGFSSRIRFNGAFPRIAPTNAPLLARALDFSPTLTLALWPEESTFPIGLANRLAPISEFEFGSDGFFGVGKSTCSAGVAWSSNTLIASTVLYSFFMRLISIYLMDHVHGEQASDLNPTMSATQAKF